MYIYIHSVYTYIPLFCWVIWKISGHLPPSWDGGFFGTPSVPVPIAKTTLRKNICWVNSNYYLKKGMSAIYYHQSITKGLLKRMSTNYYHQHMRLWSFMHYGNHENASILPGWNQARFCLTDQAVLEQGRVRRDHLALQVAGRKNVGSAGRIFRFREWTMCIYIYVIIWYDII